MSWTLEKLGDWNAEHLYRAAPYGLGQSVMWDTHFAERQVALVGMSDSWTGNAKEAADEAGALNLHAAGEASMHAATGSTAITEAAGAAEAVHADLMAEIATIQAVPGLDVAPNVRVQALAKELQDEAQAADQWIQHKLGIFTATLRTAAQQIQASTEGLQTIPGGVPGGSPVTGGYDQPHIQMGSGAQRGEIHLVDNRFKLDGPGPLPPPVPPGPPVNNGPVQTPWPPAGGVPSSVANPKGSQSWEHPPAVINARPPKPPDPGKHDCGPLEVATDTAEVVGGAVGIGTGTLPGEAAGVVGVLKGFEDFSHCEPPHDR